MNESSGSNLYAKVPACLPAAGCTEYTEYAPLTALCSRVPSDHLRQGYDWLSVYFFCGIPHFHTSTLATLIFGVSYGSTFQGYY
jgi:hypothetical protein